ncbi:MAG: zinc dependent phospholipase C family protein [PVC group bacterium]
MIWRDHKRLAAQMADAFNLGKYRDALIDGSVEPDRKRTLTHTWPKARRTARAGLYRARQAFLKGNLKRCARFLGVVSHHIADGMVHETIDTYHRSKEHSRIEDELGDMVEISALPAIDSAGEGLVDGEFVFGEIDALVREGLDNKRLGRALSLLCSAVLSPPEAPEELIETRRLFVERISRPAIKILGIAAAAAGAAGALIFHDPLWVLLLPFAFLATGKAAVFRLFARFSWLPTATALVGLIHLWPEWGKLVLTAILAGLSLYLFTFPDLSRLSEKWYRIN